MAVRPVGPLSKVPTLVLVVIASAIWGSNFVAMKEAVKYTSPILLGMARAVIGGTLLVVLSLAMGGRCHGGRASSVASSGSRFK